MDGDVVVLLFRDMADAGTPLASGKEGMTVSPLNLPFLFLVSIKRVHPSSWRPASLPSSAVF